MSKSKGHDVPDYSESLQALLDEDMPGEWECDGGDFKGTYKEVNRHILLNPDGTERDLDDPNNKCWGAMGVGGDAWKAYHEKGIHPMSTFLNSLEGQLIDSGLIIEVLKDNLEK